MSSLRKRSRLRKRQLRVQALETRQLLAAEFGEMHNPQMPEDVNADGEVSSLDALMIINRMGRPQGAEEGDRPAFRDVNNDGALTSIDALRVINRMGRDRGGDERPPADPSPVDPIDPNEVDLSEVDPSEVDPSEVDPSEVDEIRSIDGTGNNLDDPTLGSAGTELRRLVDADYADGIAEPNDEGLPSAREVSNVLAAQDESILSDRGLSDLVWQWGQFIDHDITLTEEDHGDGEAFNIEVPTSDVFFDPFGTGEQEISLTRSGAAEGTGIDSVREQVNGITAFIDGSMVYGSDAETAESLREFEGGRLAASENGLLPIDPETGFFMAGDVRANEQNGLTAMHTLFVREHNRIAEEISAADDSLTDEEIFQQARSTVIAEIQAITFNEYLPALLGRNAISDYEGYDSTVDPSISNLFATAAFRYGHTSLSSELLRLNDDGTVIDEGNLALRDAFFNPSGILELGIDPLLKGLATNVSQEIDTQLVDDVRNFLFGPPGSGGFDLASLNIQRGRDHGLPDYNSVREQLGLERAETFADISSDPEVQAKLEEAYGSVDNIDVWVGALAEDHLRGASLGELNSTVLTEQFEAIRDGDRFWYENVLEGSELREIQHTSLSDIIERNTDLTSLQENVFFSGDSTKAPVDRSPGDVDPDGDLDPIGDRNPRDRGPDGDGPVTPPRDGGSDRGGNDNRGQNGDRRDNQDRPPRRNRGLNEVAMTAEEEAIAGGFNPAAVDQVLGSLF
jgi:hypothetical protein